MRCIKNGIEFEWDNKKAASNIIKHGISFEQACDAFFDPFCRTVDATDDEEDELRDGLIDILKMDRCSLSSM